MNASADQIPSVKEIVEPLNRYFHNPIAGKIVKILMHTRVTPDQVTYASVFIGLISAYYFSEGTMSSFFLAAILLELVMILDCADGQLARAKGCASDWGRLLDGIAGYIIYLAVLIGIMLGLGKHYLALSVIGLLTILRAISYDYCKLTMITMIQKGYDGNQKEVLDTYMKIMNTSSPLLKIYYYYLQLQQFIFYGRLTSLHQFSESFYPDGKSCVLSPDQRETYRKKISALMTVWSWNGVDLPIFLLVLVSVLGMLEVSLSPLACLLGLQFVVTMIFHRIKIQDVLEIK